MSDMEIYKEPSISITPTLVKINDSTYSVANIGSVYITQQKIGGLIVASVIFGIMTLGGVGALVAPDESSSGDDRSALLGITAAFAFVMAACIVAVIKRKYYLTFRTASSDQKALASTNKQYLLKLQKAIEQAITQRG